MGWNSFVLCESSIIVGIWTLICSRSNVFSSISALMQTEKVDNMNKDMLHWVVIIKGAQVSWLCVFRTGFHFGRQYRPIKQAVRIHWPHLTQRAQSDKHAFSNTHLRIMANRSKPVIKSDYKIFTGGILIEWLTVYNSHDQSIVQSYLKMEDREMYTLVSFDLHLILFEKSWMEASNSQSYLPENAQI